MSHFPRISGEHIDLVVKGEFRIHEGIVGWGAGGGLPGEESAYLSKNSPPRPSHRQQLGRRMGRRADLRTVGKARKSWRLLRGRSLKNYLQVGSS